MGVRRIYPLPTYSTTKMLALSPLVKTSYMAGSLTWTKRSLCPYICATTPHTHWLFHTDREGPYTRSSVGEWPCTKQYNHLFRRTQKIREAFSSGTSIKMVHTAFMTWLLLILMHIFTFIVPLRSASRWKRKRKNIYGGMPPATL